MPSTDHFTVMYNKSYTRLIQGLFVMPPLVLTGNATHFSSRSRSRPRWPKAQPKNPDPDGTRTLVSWKKDVYATHSEADSSCSDKKKVYSPISFWHTGSGFVIDIRKRESTFLIFWKIKMKKCTGCNKKPSTPFRSVYTRGKMKATFYEHVVGITPHIILSLRTKLRAPILPPLN